MRIVWSPFANTNLRDIHDYYDTRNPQAASKLLIKIYTSARNLSHYPNLGKPNRLKTCRLLQVPKTAYVLPYRVIGDTIQILAVFDQRQEKPEQYQ